MMPERRRTAMAVRIVRLGSPRTPDEGLRIGTVRRPPRGVPKAAFASGDWYDVRFPNLSPSPELVKRALASQSDLSAAGEKEWAAFTRGYRAEMARPDNAHAIGRGALPSLDPARAAAR